MKTTNIHPHWYQMNIKTITLFSLGGGLKKLKTKQDLIFFLNIVSTQQPAHKIQVKVSFVRNICQKIRLVSKSQILQDPPTSLNQKKSDITEPPTPLNQKKSAFAKLPLPPLMADVICEQPLMKHPDHLLSNNDSDDQFSNSRFSLGKNYLFRIWRILHIWKLINSGYLNNQNISEVKKLREELFSQPSQISNFSYQPSSNSS